MVKKDFFRDTWVRYLGYANEVGESFRLIIPLQYVHYSYGVAFGYVLADTVDKGFGKILSDGRPTKVLWATGDCLLWQVLASVVIPGLVINRIVAHSNTAIAKYAPKIKTQQRAWITVGIGLACIPIIVRPIDFGVHLFMECTYRRLFK